MTILKKIYNAIKKYNPSKEKCLLYFLIPIIVFIFAFEYQDDLWFILNYGKYIVHNGFPVIEPFTIHLGLDFIIQQWLSSVLFYGVSLINFRYGLFFLCLSIFIIILFLVYKIGMLLSDGNYKVSTFISVLTGLALLLFRFINPRPQIIDFIFLLLVIYIMEKYKKDSNTKLIYFLPLISLLQINFHSMLWFMLFIFMLPYIAEFIINKITKDDNRVFKLLLIMLIMLGVGLINPYGIKSILNLFTSYGNKYADILILELQPVVISSMVGALLFIIVFIIVMFYIFNKQKPSISHLLLSTGTLLLALMHGRSISLFLIAAIPIMSAYFKKTKKLDTKSYSNKDYKIVVILFCIIVGGLSLVYIQPPKSYMEDGINKLLETYNPSDITMYTNFDNGPYVEYCGVKTYIDTRAEIFYKSNNHKADIFDEYYHLHTGNIDYKEFVDKYNFTHLVITKEEWLYKKIKNDKDYKIFYDNEKYTIFEKV